MYFLITSAVTSSPTLRTKYPGPQNSPAHSPAYSPTHGAGLHPPPELGGRSLQNTPEYRVHPIEMLGGLALCRFVELRSQFLSNPDDFPSKHIKIILDTAMIRYRHSQSVLAV